MGGGVRAMRRSSAESPAAEAAALAARRLAAFSVTIPGTRRFQRTLVGTFSIDGAAACAACDCAVSAARAELPISNGTASSRVGIRIWSLDLKDVGEAVTR